MRLPEAIVTLQGGVTRHFDLPHSVLLALAPPAASSCEGPPASFPEGQEHLRPS